MINSFKKIEVTMNFTITLPDLQKALLKTIPALPRKSTIPVLEHLHFSAKDNVLSIIASDQDMTIMTKVDVTCEEEGEVLVPGKRFNDIIRALGNTGAMEFKSDNESFNIQIQTSFGKYKMKGIDPNEYLTLPELFKSEKPSINLDNTTETVQPVDDSVADEVLVEEGEEKPPVIYLRKDEICFLTEKTSYAVSNDEYRPAMNGVLFQFRGSYINSVATDSYRLVKACISPEQQNLPDEMDIIFSARTADLLKKSENDVIVSFVVTRSKITHARFDTENTVIVSRIIDEKFPPYESVIPINNNLFIRLLKSELLNTIKRISIFSNQMNHQIKMKLTADDIIIGAEDDDTASSGFESINGEYNGEPMEIGFNHKLLEELIQYIDTGDDDRIRFEFSEHSKAVLIKADDDSDSLLMIIMPSRTK